MDNDYENYDSFDALYVSTQDKIYDTFSSITTEDKVIKKLQLEVAVRYCKLLIKDWERIVQTSVYYEKILFDETYFEKLKSDLHVHLYNIYCREYLTVAL